MATFANWLNNQLTRDDAVGYIAKYWHQASPGRVSAVSGVEKHLRKIEADYEIQPEGMEEAAWQRGRASIAAALAGFKFAVTEYHQEQSLEVARETGALPPKLVAVPEPPQEQDPELVPESHQRVTAHPAERGLAGSGKDLHITGKRRELAFAAAEPQDTGWHAEGGSATHETVTETGYIPAWAVRIEARLDAMVEMLDLICRGLYSVPENAIDWDELAAMADYAAVTE
jgi:hypothetical protein